MTQSVYTVIEVPKYVGWPAVVLISFGILWWAAGRAAYFPFRYPQGEWWLKDRIGAADVWLTTEDRVKLHAWWLDAPESKYTLLYLHGNAGNITHRSFKMAGMRGAGTSVLALDYRGYGRSEGRPSESGLYADALAAYDYLAKSGRPVVLYGESLGTSVAVDLATRRPCAGLILEAPFASGSELAGRVLPLIGPLIFRDYNTIAKIDRVSAPMLFIQGTRDEVVPIAQGKRLFASVTARKEFWELPNADHNTVFESAGPEFAERLRQFYSSL